MDLEGDFSKDFPISGLDLTFKIEKKQEEFKGKNEDVVVLFLKNTSEISSEIAVEAYFKDKKGARRLIEKTFISKLILECNLHFKMLSKLTKTGLSIFDWKQNFTIGFQPKFGI